VGGRIIVQQEKNINYKHASIAFAIIIIRVDLEEY
jgi:hypothetical protein